VRAQPLGSQMFNTAPWVAAQHMTRPSLKAQHCRPQLEVWLTTFGNTSQHSIQMEE